jgi:7-cyano-7-deazaguanine synthase
MNEKKALVLFSGGQDSAVCLAWALNKFDAVETLAFDYRQRHAVELETRLEFIAGLRRAFPHWGAKLGDDTILDAGALAALGETAMTHDTPIRTEENGLPNTFVPGRNLVFFTMAAALAYRRDCGLIVSGVCETDYSGYPDCREETVRAVERAVNLGMDRDFGFLSPLMRLDKAETWEMADELGGGDLTDLVVRLTHSCYLGRRDRLHDWGYGCGECPACLLRRKGYAAFMANRK